MYVQKNSKREEKECVCVYVCELVMMVQSSYWLVWVSAWCQHLDRNGIIVKPKHRGLFRSLSVYSRQVTPSVWEPCPAIAGARSGWSLSSTEWQWSPESKEFWPPCSTPPLHKLWFWPMYYVAWLPAVLHSPPLHKAMWFRPACGTPLPTPSQSYVILTCLRYSTPNPFTQLPDSDLPVVLHSQPLHIAMIVILTCLRTPIPTPSQSYVIPTCLRYHPFTKLCYSDLPAVLHSPKLCDSDLPAVLHSPPLHTATWFWPACGTPLPTPSHSYDSDSDLPAVLHSPPLHKAVWFWPACGTPLPTPSQSYDSDSDLPAVLHSPPLHKAMWFWPACGTPLPTPSQSYDSDSDLPAVLHSPPLHKAMWFWPACGTPLPTPSQSWCGYCTSWWAGRQPRNPR